MGHAKRPQGVHHGLLGRGGGVQWRTLVNGSRAYVAEHFASRPEPPQGPGSGEMPYTSGPVMCWANPENGVSATARRARVFLTTLYEAFAARSWRRKSVSAVR